MTSDAALDPAPSPEIAATEQAARDHLVGSVMSGWNHFQETGRTVIERADGCRVVDTAGHERLDWIMGWGSLVLGHRPEAVYRGISQAQALGYGYMYESPRNGELAQLISEMVPCGEKMRLANSGTEATLNAMRIARAHTGRSRFVKFEGHFHGLNDYLLYGVDGGKELGHVRDDGTIAPTPGSAGLPDEVLTPLILVVPFNDSDALNRVFERYGPEIAGVILEPVALNIGCVAPDPGFLALIREVTEAHGALMIYDEVLTGFRLGRGGAQELFGVVPDLACLGKALGCGMPAAAVCGRAEVMDALSPTGDAEMAGTNTGRQMTVSGTLAALREMEARDVWRRLAEANDHFVGGCRDVLGRYGVPAHVQGFGGRIGIHIGDETPPRTFRDVVSRWNGAYHRELYRSLHATGRLFGFLLPLGPCPEPVTLSAVHTDADLDETLTLLEDAVRRLPYRAGSA
ncbi:MAG: aminotransferase class III-fold pyridoxal phosphate-dependent enzyme [Alphaproteobacteria bacterium]|jgi:glutamate-1-semialdehyde 2,1-aminomutase|nr:aminotransferase class III-fold pyridoxal phosphate-dependent enzyme [Alphaproteobacteria bacterium]